MAYSAFEDHIGKCQSPSHRSPQSSIRNDCWWGRATGESCRRAHRAAISTCSWRCWNCSTLSRRSAQIASPYWASSQMCHLLQIFDRYTGRLREPIFFAACLAFWRQNLSICLIKGVGQAHRGFPYSCLPSYKRIRRGRAFLRQQAQSLCRIQRKRKSSNLLCRNQRLSQVSWCAFVHPWTLSANSRSSRSDSSRIHLWADRSYQSGSEAP